ncbi:hypothetical protein FVEN_g12406 [Fusarium venenatum]|nr:hypothetical protein FVEN_g12406 [Fusarium venenatum]
MGKSILNVRGSHETLQASFCQVCQLFALLKTSDLDNSSSSLRAISAKWLFTKPTSNYPHLKDTTLLSIDSESNLRRFKKRKQMGHVIAVEPLSTPATFLQPRRVNLEKIDFPLIRFWMNQCNNKHPASCKPENITYPQDFKVIDCKGKAIISPKVNCSYVALSYVWGNTCRSNLNHPNTWPQVVKDSIAVALKLECDYLWVDRLCIDQDDPLKHEQMKRMDEIYSGAKFTIIDATGDDRTYGLSGVTLPRQPNPPRAYVEIDGVKLTYLHTPPADKIRSSRWASRGWTYQEGILSRRRIFFTSDQVMFQCNNMTCLEAFAIPMDALQKSNGNGGHRQPHLNDIEPILMAKQNLDGHLMAYSKRDLKYDEDSLNAFLGILSHYSGPGKPYVHFLGSPIHRVKGSMINAWYHLEPAKRRDQFPSWSWTGWKGEVKLTSRSNPDHEIGLMTENGDRTSLEKYIKACDDNQTLPMKHVIELTGKMTTFSFKHIKWSLEPNVRNNGLDEPKLQDGPWAILPLTTDIRCYSFLYLDDASLAAESQFELPVIVLELGTESKNHNIIILVLKESSDHYERVGLITIRHAFQITNEDDRWKGQPKQVIYLDKAERWLPRAPISEPLTHIWLQGTEKKTILVK